MKIGILKIRKEDRKLVSQIRKIITVEKIRKKLNDQKLPVLDQLLLNETDEE